MAKSIKNVKNIVIWIVLGLVAVAGLLTAFLANYNAYSPNAPIVFDDGTNIYLSTTFNDNYEGYRFKFTSQGEEIIVDSDDNVIEANEVLENGAILGEKYDVSVCYLAKNSGNNSQYSKVTEWICQSYLSTTTITRNITENKLVWANVDGADYYRIYYNNAEEEFFLDTTELSLDLQQFVGGEKMMYLVACSRNSNLKQSGKSNTLEFNLQHYFSEFSNLTFDKKTKILTAENNENLEKIVVRLNTTSYISIKFEVQEKENVFVYSIDLTAIYNNENVIGLKPADVDEFNVFVGNESIVFAV